MADKDSTFDTTAQATEGTAPDPTAIKAKYGKVYQIDAELAPDDETTLNREYFFKKPTTPSYNRYIKTASQNMTKSMETFLYDNVTDESRQQLTADLEEYPALSLSLGEKLLAMLGLTKSTNLKQL